MGRVAKIALVLVCALVGAAVTAPALAHESRTLVRQIDSAALKGKMHLRVVLPPGYAQTTERYPVVYFLHGLPASPTAYLGNGFVADAIERAGRAILVFPQGARDDDSDPEYLNWGSGRNWETYVASEVPRYIDSHFRTIRSRRGRALVGLSAGGYGATTVGLHHLGAFSVIESWSGYFHPTDPTGTKALDRGPESSAHTLIAGLRADERRRPTFIAFYVGLDDTRFRAENVQFAHELSAAHIPHLFALYAGAHETSLWSAHATAWLRMALDHLSGPS